MFVGTPVHEFGLIHKENEILVPKKFVALKGSIIKHTCAQLPSPLALRLSGNLTTQITQYLVIQAGYFHLADIIIISSTVTRENLTHKGTLQTKLSGDSFDM